MRRYIKKTALIDKKTKKYIICNEIKKYCKCAEQYQKKIYKTESFHDLYYGEYAWGGVLDSQENNKN